MGRSGGKSGKIGGIGPSSPHTAGRFSDSPIFALSEAVSRLNVADLWAAKQKETRGNGQE